MFGKHLLCLTHFGCFHFRRTKFLTCKHKPELKKLICTTCIYKDFLKCPYKYNLFIPHHPIFILKTFDEQGAHYTLNFLNKMHEH